MEKIRSLIDWPRPDDDPAAQYVWLLLSGTDYDPACCSRCPEHYREHEDFWLTTARTMIHDNVDGEPAELSLGLAIDMLWPCRWRFVANLRIVLDAIGGHLHPAEPFAACGRNIALVPNRNRMQAISRTLQVFCGDAPSDHTANPQLLALLGEPTPVKRWLAASLGKTIRLQLDAPAELRAALALAAPDWIGQ